MARLSPLSVVCIIIYGGEVMEQENRPRYSNVDLEKRVISFFLRVDSTIPISLDYFTIPEARQLFLFVNENKRLSANSLDDWWSLWKIELQRKYNEVGSHEKFLQSLWIEDVEEEGENISYYIEELKGYAEARSLYTVFSSSIQRYNEGDVTEARRILEDGVLNLKQNFTPQVMSRSDFVEGFADRYKHYGKRKRGEEIAKIPTGIVKLDKKIEGAARASLNFIQGEAGSGKTFILMEIAYQGSINGHNVLFVTVELQRREIEVRWDGRLTGLPYLKIDKGELLKEEEGLWRKRIRNLKKMYEAGGRLATVAIPEGCNILSLESELAFWKEKWGGKIDILVVDYADLMESTRKAGNEQEAQGMVFRDLKRLSQTHDLVVWTASQISGRGYGKRQITQSETGYSFRKNNWANLILGIGADALDKEEGIIRLYVAKNTFGKSGFEVILVPDFERSMIDVESRK